MQIKNNKLKQRFCFSGLKLKEEDGSLLITGLTATSHPDRAGGEMNGVEYVGDILSEKAIDQIVEHINNTDEAGGQNGAYRSVSLYHDWIKQADPTLDEVAFLKPNARKVKTSDGHYGAEVDAELNKFYKGDIPIEEVQYRIDNGQIAGFSIEYDTDNEHSRLVESGGNTYRFIDSLTQFGGTGLARARLIANTAAVIYKEIEDTLNKKSEATPMENKEDDVKKPDEVIVKPVTPEVKIEDVKTGEDKSEPVKEEVINSLVKQVKEQALAELNIASKIVKQTKETQIKMDKKELPLSVKEMKSAISGGKIDIMKFKEAVSTYFIESPEVDLQLKDQYETRGILLRPTLQTKCVGNKVMIVGGLQIKSTLDTTTNPGAYTESIVEFADLFIPGLIETFNNQDNLFGAVSKRNHLMGGNTYGWKIKTDQASSLSVDPNDPSIVKDPVKKLNLRTDIKEYRIGVSVTDYVMYHGRATMGDLLMVEADARMDDMMRDINNDMFTEQVDTAGTKILGLEAVADSAGNTSIYGKTRTIKNRLAPDAATDTYEAVGGALTTAYIRGAARKVEGEGALRANLKIVVNATQRDALFELEDGNQTYFNSPKFGFDGQISYDRIGVITDSSCPTDALFVIDNASYYIVVSRSPQLIGLAKVGAAEEAYINTFIAAVYEQPRRIHMLDTLA